MAEAQPTEGKMVQLLEVTAAPTKKSPQRVKFEFHRSILEELVQRPELSDLPFLVLGIGGVKRIGKSFLINLLAKFLEYREENPSRLAVRDWLKTNPRITGTEWKQSTDAVTQGIQIWNRPFVIQTASSSSKVAVILLDCEGMYDIEELRKGIQGVLTIVALELSSVLLFNSQGGLNFPDLEALELALTQANTATSNLDNMSRVFRCLVMLFRNFQSDENYGARKELQLAKNKRMYDLITGAFKGKYSEFAFPPPGGNVRKASASQRKTLQEFMGNEDSEEFLKCVAKFFDFLFNNNPFDGRHLKTRDDMNNSLKMLIEYHKQEYIDCDLTAVERRRILETWHQLETNIFCYVESEIRSESLNSREDAIKVLEYLEKGALDHIAQSEQEYPAHEAMAKETWREVKDLVTKRFENFKKKEKKSCKAASEDNILRYVGRGIVRVAAFISIPFGRLISVPLSPAERVEKAKDDLREDLKEKLQENGLQEVANKYGENKVSDFTAFLSLAIADKKKSRSLV